MTVGSFNIYESDCKQAKIMLYQVPVESIGNFSVHYTADSSGTAGLELKLEMTGVGKQCPICPNCSPKTLAHFKPLKA